MRLITGPAGSGKTTYILNQFRERLRAREGGVRLLVPTATLAQHLQNRLAREGFVLRRGFVQTLSGFVRELTPEVIEVAETVLYLIVEAAAKRVARPEFARVVDFPGFCASLTRVIHEFTSAGCDSRRLAPQLPDAPLGEAFLAIYEEVDLDLARRGLMTRASRLGLASTRIAESGLRAVWMDGFHVLTDPDLAAIEAIGRHAALTLALGDDDLTAALRTRLLAMGFHEERAGAARGTPVRALIKAASIEREVEEIARRILEQAAAGRPWSEMGIIVRAADVYVPLLRTTLERFGIPARFYFDADLEHHPTIRHLAGIVDAMLGGWDHAGTLAALRLAPRFAESRAMDRFDFAVREQIPKAGLSELRSLATDEGLIQTLDSLAALEEWRSLELAPKDWAARFRGVRELFGPARPLASASHEMALEWRSQSEALAAFGEAFEEAAQAMDATGAVGLEPYWRTVKSVLRLQPLRSADGRRNVVQVLSAHEAREWVLPVVWVCGMVEKQFPRFQQQDPFFPDAARCRLSEAGVRVRTSAEFDREERALFDSAVTRGTLLTTLSYPEFDARGERNLPSLYLEDLLLAPEAARPVKPAPRRQPVLERGAAEIGDVALLEWLRAHGLSFSPTGLESFLQCPFQYFAMKTLRLRTAPGTPEDRLDFLTMGNLVHDVLKEWWAEPQEMAPLFERVFARYREEKHIPGGYHTERKRNAMLDDLTRFATQDPWPRIAFTSQTEIEFEFPLAERTTIRGRIDRLDTAPDGRAYVIDYKYSRAANVKDKVKNENLLQAPLYLMAAKEVHKANPAGVFYVGLRTGLEYVGWSDTPFLDALAMPADWLNTTRERTLKIVEEIRSGRVSIHPSDPDKCRYCDAKDVCRIEVGKAALQAEGA